MGDFIFGTSKAMKDVKRAVYEIASSDLPVFIEGETGTGKTLLARTIHDISHRNIYNFEILDCASLSETLVESSLFGYEKGAFTDAKERKKGIFEIVNKGTLFLDEVQNFNGSVQKKLLTILGDNCFKRVGGNDDIFVDFRIISASNDHLRDKVSNGEFRRDLFYRLKGTEIYLPPLRERKEDIYLIAESFLKILNMSKGWERVFSSKVKSLLESYIWPGNIRELKHAVTEAAFRAKNNVIDCSYFSLNCGECFSVIESSQHHSSLAQIEKEYISYVLKIVKNNKTQAAKRLGIGLNTLYRKIQKYGLLDV